MGNGRGMKKWARDLQMEEWWIPTYTKFINE
jgi:hypothetical protein